MKIQVLPVIINETTVYKLNEPDGGFRLRTGSDLITSDHTLVAIRAAGVNNTMIAEILTAYLFTHGDDNNDDIHTEDEIMKSLDNKPHHPYPPFRCQIKSPWQRIGKYLLNGVFYAAVAWLFFLVILHFFY